MDKLAYLREKLTAFTSFIPHSRSHNLKTFNSKVKRDDELGFGISGSKLRKYTSLIPYLLSHHYQEVVVIGSAHSNHVLGLTQLLIENCIKPTLFLLGDPSMLRQGNLLLTSLLVPETEWQWISREQWPNVEQLAADYVKQTPLQTTWIPEGGSMDAALPGALTLPLDILENEEELDHLFIDAGTGFSAIATVLAFAWLNKKTELHILLLADTQEQFLAKLSRFQKSFEQFLGVTLHSLGKLTLHLPTEARSFGAVNATIFNHIRFLAAEEGFFTDPIYSAKLFLEAKMIIEKHKLKGNNLIVHSGGALTLMGFQKQLST